MNNLLVNFIETIITNIKEQDEEIILIGDSVLKIKSIDISMSEKDIKRIEKMIEDLKGEK